MNLAEKKKPSFRSELKLVRNIQESARKTLLKITRKSTKKTHSQLNIKLRQSMAE